MRDYGKVHSQFWASPTIAALSDDGKLLALYLMTCQHNTIAGVFRLPDGYAAEDLGWSPERVRKGFAELFANGFANRCETTKWVWVIKHLEWNPPENPNQRKSATKCASLVPANCVWHKDFLVFIAKALPDESNPLPTVPKPLPNQEQEQEQEQKQKGSAKSRQTTLPDNFTISDRVREWAKEKGHTNLDVQLEAFLSYVKRKGAKYTDWDEALMTAIRDNWAKVPPSTAPAEGFI